VESHQSEKSTNHKMLLQVLTVVAAGIFAYSFYDPTGANWFSWHPLFMIIAYGIFMSTALYFQRVKKFTIGHIALNFLGCVTSGFAFVVIYGIKRDNSWPHIQTWHSYFGIAVLGMQFMAFTVSFLMGVVLGQKGHWIHPIQGKLIFILSLAALFTGYYKKTEAMWKIACFGAFIAVAFVSFLGGRPTRPVQETKTK
jgi:hypothetical protein